MYLVKHKHHIIPRHMGGTDDPSNLIELTIEQHAQAHLDLYEEHGRWQDQLAYRMLSGSITNAEAIREAQRQGQVDRWAKHTPEERSAMKKGEKNGMYGKKQSQNQKDAVSKALKGKKKWYKVTTPLTSLSGADNGMARAVVYKGVEYPTVGFAAEAAGVSRVTAGKKLKAQHPDWRYKGGQNLQKDEK